MEINLLKYIYLNFIMLCVLAGFADGRTFDIFDSEDGDNISIQSIAELPPALPMAATRFRAVRLNSAISDAEALISGDTLNLSLFDDKFYTASVDKVTKNINGTVTVRARIDGSEMGYFLISTTDGLSSGYISIPEDGLECGIDFLPDMQSHFLMDIDTDADDAMVDSPPLVAPEQDVVLRLQDTAANDPLELAIVDVMIVYTPAAKLWAQSASGINNTIAQAMEKAQLTLDNSGTMLTLRLIYSSEISYTESGDSNTDLTRLTNQGDGYMDSVHTLRNEYGADLVSLFASVSDTGGLGYLLTSVYGNPDNGFSLIRVQQAATYYTFIHEIGHNFGCHHHKLQNYQPGPNTVLNTYSAGWRWTGTDGLKYCSVMSYTSGTYYADGQTHTQVAYFSNPDIFHQGVPTGGAADGNNARTIRETKFAVAAYKVQGAYIPGSGTAADPYRISAASQLDSVNTDLTAHYILIADIDLAGATYTRSVIAPYNNSSSPVFTGSFDGKGFAVKNVTIAGGTNDYIGLFGQIDSIAVISNIVMKNVNISGDDDVGSLAGYNWGTIQNCYASGQVSGRYCAGGLVGTSDDGSLIQCAADCTVAASTGRAGGLCGNNMNTTINNCYALGIVSGAGSAYGGLCGYNNYYVINSYSAAQVSSTGLQVGGMIGVNVGDKVLNSFWDTQASSRQSSAAGTGKTTAEMKTQSTFVSAGWDFTQRWHMSHQASEFVGYPVLIWQGVTIPESLDISLVPGWNWISFNVLPENAVLENVLANYNGADNDVIIGSDGKNATYYGGSWYGSLKNIVPGLMYKLKSLNGGNLTVYGDYVVHTTEIPLVEGWNWLGYCLAEPKALSQAIDLLQATNEDTIIAPDGKNATYFNGVWYGTLTDMEPGKGYMLKVTQAQVFSYTSSVASKMPAIASFAGQWLMPGYGLEFDLWPEGGDGIVDIRDFVEFADKYYNMD